MNILNLRCHLNDRELIKMINVFITLLQKEITIEVGMKKKIKSFFLQTPTYIENFKLDWTF